MRPADPGSLFNGRPISDIGGGFYKGKASDFDSWDQGFSKGAADKGYHEFGNGGGFMNLSGPEVPAQLNPWSQMPGGVKDSGSMDLQQMGAEIGRALKVEMRPVFEIMRWCDTPAISTRCNNVVP
jgi:hypothetical protein